MLERHFRGKSRENERHPAIGNVVYDPISDADINVNVRASTTRHSLPNIISALVKMFHIPFSSARERKGLWAKCGRAILTGEISVSEGRARRAL